MDEIEVMNRKINPKNIPMKICQSEMNKRLVIRLSSVAVYDCCLCFVDKPCKDMYTFLF